MATIAQLRERPGAKPVYLAQIQLLNGGPLVYWALININIGGHQYGDYIDELKGVDSALSLVDTAVNNLGITISCNNTRWREFAYLSEGLETYPITGAAITLLETYLDNAGVPASDGPVILTKGFVEQPETITPLGFECKVSSRLYHYDRTFAQKIIDTTTWPGSWEDTGKYEPKIIGSGLRVPAERVNWGPRTTLAYNISDTTTNPVDVTLPDSSHINLGIMLSIKDRFPAAGTVTIDDEDIAYTGIDSGGNLTGVSRAQNGTAATSHNTGATVWIKQTNYDSLLADHQLHSVFNIYAEINGELVKVLSGASALFTGGKHLIRATSQIGIDSGLLNSLGLDLGSHNHLSSGSATQVWGTGSSHSAGAYTTFSGADANMRDQNMAGTGATLQSDGSMGTSPSGSFNVTLPSAGSGNWYACVSYKGSIGGNGGSIMLSAGGQNISLGPSASQTMKKFSVGSAPTNMTVTWNDGSYTGVRGICHVYELWYEYSTSTISNSPAAGVLLTGAIALVDTWKVERFHADVDGAIADNSGNYGTNGSAIETPDNVIKYWLVQQFGAPIGDMNAASFSAAAALYAAAISGGYKFGFRIDEQITPSSFIQSLAFQCRSTLKDTGGQFQLVYLGDSPPQPVKTISQSELAAPGYFTFDKDSIENLCNDITAKFKWDYSRVGTASEWLGTSVLDDATSKTQYAATYHKDLEFKYIHTQAFADHLVAHLLLRWKDLRLICTCNVFFEHFDLVIGNTFAISGPIYNGRLFKLTEQSRPDQITSSLKAIEWW